jgi:hypothetical protein
MSFLKSRETTTVFATLLLVLLLAQGPVFAVPAQTRSHDPAKAEVLTLPVLPEGFASEKVTVDAGLYWIDVLNRTSVRGLRIEIDRMPGSSLLDIPLKREAEGQEDRDRSRFLKMINLTAGTYRVRVAGHPSWICAIIVR